MNGRNRANFEEIEQLLVLKTPGSDHSVNDNDDDDDLEEEEKEEEDGKEGEFREDVTEEE